jgi:hypothetical protein
MSAWSDTLARLDAALQDEAMTDFRWRQFLVDLREAIHDGTTPGSRVFGARIMDVYHVLLSRIRRTTPDGPWDPVSPLVEARSAAVGKLVRPLYDHHDTTRSAQRAEKAAASEALEIQRRTLAALEELARRQGGRAAAEVDLTLLSTLEEQVVTQLASADGLRYQSSTEIATAIQARHSQVVDDREVRRAMGRMRDRGWPIDGNGRGFRIPPSARDRLPALYRQ